MITLHTPSGIVQVDPATVTDAELATLGLTRAWADERLAEEVEEKALAKAGSLIDAISNLAEAKVFLKRLCKRLIMKGSL